MTLESDLKEIRKKLEDHEKRIAKLEGSGEVAEKAKKKAKVSISDHLGRLKSQGFFDQPKLTSEIVDQLAAEGFHYPPESLSWPLQSAVRKKELGRIKREKKWAYCKR